MRARIFVRGRIQQVGYRNFVRIIAKRNNIIGAIRNLKSGEVEIFAEGTTEDFANFLGQIKPKDTDITSAVVEDVEIAAEGEPWRNYGTKFLIDDKNGN